MQDQTGRRMKIIKKVGEDKISALHEDLLVEILLLVPTKDAVASSLLSKRWRYIWIMLPKLDFNPPSSLEEPTRLFKSLYTFKTLKALNLSNNILIDVPSEAFLPSLVHLELFKVVYENEDSLVRLLSNCPLLQSLYVERKRNDDNVTNFSVKVSSLQLLKYKNTKRNNKYNGGSLVIDCPGLKFFSIEDLWRGSCLIENMPPYLDVAKVESNSHPNDNLLRSISSVMYLNLTLTDEADAICSAVKFSRLIECKLAPFISEYWVQSVMNLLHNAPKLRVLMIDSNDTDDEPNDLALLSSVPECLSSSLEILEWEDYEGTREEKKLLAYILANSKCLKTVRISLNYAYYEKDKKKEKMKMTEELESMDRVSKSSQLFFSIQFRWSSMKQHPAYEFMRF